MWYITYKNFKGMSLSGNVCIPRMTKCKCEGNIIFSPKGKPIAYTTSQVAYDYFVRDDDDMGTKRGELIINIMSMLRTPKNPANKDVYNLRWKAIWADKMLWKFRRPEHEKFWCWNHAFYNANIEDLQYIFEKIKAIRR